jgi:hypothetical protein
MTTGPESSGSLEAPRIRGITYPSWRPDEILPRLFMGGTRDEGTVADPMPLQGLGGRRRYDAVATLFAWAQPVGWEVEELRYGFGDGSLRGADAARVIRAARWVHDRWRAGDRVLVRCQAGLNRSGLVTALVLILEGWQPADAIGHLRERRSPYVLFNPHFERWLLAEAPGALREGSVPDAAR